MNWNLSNAKEHLNEVLDRARRDGPQTIEREGGSFVVLTVEQYDGLTGQRPSFTDWLLHGPRFDGVDLPRRSESPMHDGPR